MQNPCGETGSRQCINTNEYVFFFQFKVLKKETKKKMIK